MIEVTTQTVAVEPRRVDGRRRVAILGSLLLILAAAAAALFLMQSVDTQLGEVVRTYDSRSNARQLILSLNEAESAQRGFLLTGDEAYLAPFNAALEIVDEKTRTLLATTEEGSVQRSRVNSLVDWLDQKHQEMLGTIEALRANRLDEALATLKTDSGLKLMQGIRSVVDAFIADENVILTERSSGFNQARVGLAVAIIAALAGASILAWIVLRRGRAEVTALTRDRSSLLTQNEELESRVRERTMELEVARAHAEAEQRRVEALLQDTSHRIGNSLATVSSLLALQMSRVTSPEVKAALEAAKDRVHAIASGHRRLRLGPDMETTKVADFLNAVLDDFRSTQIAGRPIIIETDILDTSIKARDATTIATIVAELMTNAVKHAFPQNRPGKILVSLLRDSEGVVALSVADDGCGAGEEAGLGGGLGSLIVTQLSRQYGGVPLQQSRVGGGTEIIVPLPTLETGEA